MRQKVKLYIGDQLADLGDDSFILFNYAMEDLSNPTIVRNSWSKTVTLPGTPTNNGIFGHIARSDRETQYASGQYTGVYFDANVRTPFQIFADTGELLESGYLKLDSMTRRGKRVDYSVTLYGGLGAFFYALSYDENGNKRTLSTLKFTGSSAADTELDFTISKATIKNAWNQVTGGTTSYPLYNILNFAPCYNGLPQGTFDADKALAVPSLVGIALPSGYTAPDNWVMVTMPEKHTDIEMRDLRSYLQRPVLSMKALINAICQDYNNGGYTVELDPAFFADSNPYWSKAWMTLPMLDTLVLNVSESTVQTTGTNVTAATETFTIVGGGVAGTRYVVNFTFTPKISGTNLTSESFWYMYGEPSGGAIYQNWLQFTVKLKNGSTLLDTATFRISSRPAEQPGVPQIDFVGSFSPQSSSIATFGPQVIQASLQGLGATSVEITWSANSNLGAPNVIFNENASVSKLISYQFDYTASCRKISSTAVRSGSTITKQKLLAGDYTPADYLLSYCKLFGLVFKYDQTAKKVSIMKRQTFFDSASGAIDLTGRVNVGKDITVRPFAFDSRWYELSLEDVPGEFLEYYKTVYGRRYGSQRINTGFDFNANTKDLLNGNVFRSAAQVQEVSRYFATYWYNFNGSAVNFPSVFQDAGATFEVRSNSTGNMESFDVPAIPITATVLYWNSSTPGYDFISRPQFHGDDGKALDGTNVLLLYDGFMNPQLAGAEGLAVTDDLSMMSYRNDNTPCWLLNWGYYLTSDKVTRFPKFSRYTVSSGAVQYSLDFDVPFELRIPSLTYASSTALYERFWQTYIADRYDDDSKVMTAWVDLRGMQVGPELLRRFYYWDGAIWSLNRIMDYSLTTYDDTQCEFVKVQDIDAYTT